MEKPTQDKSDEIRDLKERIKWLTNRLEIYEVATQGVNDGLWDWDFVNDKPFVSKPWKTMLGIEENAKVDIRALWEKLLHPDDKERAANYLQEFIKSNNSDYRQEFRMKHANGSYIWILSKAKAVRDDDGRLLRLSGSHTDISERKRNEEALSISEEKYRSLFENSLVGMFRTDYATGALLETNDKFWDIVGSNADESTSTFDFYKDPKDREHVINLVKKNGKAENEELEIRRADGELIWVSFSIKHYKDEGILETILIDITETKHNFLELQKVNFELDSFVYHASHDLRSPLRSVLGLIDLYRMENSVKIREQCIERIEHSIKRLDDLVQELLSLSRNDRVSDEHVEINLFNEINNSISSYYNATDTTGLQIYIDVRHEKQLKTDATRVRIILNNIISNAIKYRRFDGVDSYIRIKAEVFKSKAKISIEDNGEGIEESKLPHIFDMFYRATEKSVGSGLGLYIVKKAADKLNAKVQVTSKELEGTTFNISIPNFYY